MSSSEFGLKPVYLPIANSTGTIVEKTNASQLTDVTTGVTVNGFAGVITTQAATTAGAATEAFTVTNSQVKANSIVMVSIIGYSGTLTTNGIPIVTVDTVAAGSFNINISNVHATNALSGTLQISYQIL